MGQADKVSADPQAIPVHVGNKRGALLSDLLVQELAEVYLLLDNISAVASKAVPDLSDDPVFAKPIFGRRATWIEQICEIRWPPGNQPHERQALSAAKLIRAKDALNAAAGPASGASIAFTLMMSNDPPPPVSLRLHAPKRWGHFFGRTQSENDSDDKGRPREIAHVPPSNDRLEMHQPVSRLSLAQLAFPALAYGIRRNRLYYNCINGFLVIALFVTCLLSWDIAAGSAMLNRVNSLKTVQAAALQKGGKPAGASPSATPTGSASSTGTTDVRGASDLRVPLDNLRRWVEANWFLEWLVGGWNESAINAPDVVTAQTTTVTKVQHCHSVGPVSPSASRPAAPGGQQCQVYAYSHSGTAMAQLPDPNVEWAAVMIGVLAGTILPICYGVLGASAAVVRNIVARMSASTLMPRDLILSLVQLGLGAVIGACVGLFVTSDGNGAAGENGLLGPVHLSGAALCFLAGFGVEGVFRALESLVGRVFPVGSTGVAQGRPMATATATIITRKS